MKKHFFNKDYHEQPKIIQNIIKTISLFIILYITFSFLSYRLIRDYYAITDFQIFDFIYMDPLCEKHIYFADKETCLSGHVIYLNDVLKKHEKNTNQLGQIISDQKIIYPSIDLDDIDKKTESEKEEQLIKLHLKWNQMKDIRLNSLMALYNESLYTRSKFLLNIYDSYNYPLYTKIISIF